MYVNNVIDLKKNYSCCNNVYSTQHGCAESTKLKTPSFVISVLSRSFPVDLITKLTLTNKTLCILIQLSQA